RAGTLAAVAYLPWFLFAWSYYGSPIPHTVTAKAADQFFVGGSPLATAIGISSTIFELSGDALGPVYGLGTWPEWMGWTAILGTLFAALVWTSARVDRFARGCSLCLLLTLIYLSLLRIQRDAYPWYFGPASLLTILVWARLTSVALSARNRAWYILPSC